MNKIMIVDDMPIFLEYLRGCIDWNAYGFEICCEAHDGREALEKMEEYMPDVVLTDITMPYLNGLELSERIIKDYPDTAVVLITGNNEFEYARKAVKIGVCDYIVKPFEKEELILSLLKLQDNIGKAVENSDTNENLLQDELRALIYAGVSDSEHGTDLENRIFENAGGGHGYLLGLLKFADKLSDEHTREELMNWESLIAKMLGDKLDIDGDVKIFNDFENNIVIIMRFNNESELSVYKGYEFTDIVDIVKNQLGFDIVIALSKAEDITEVKRAYEKAMGFAISKGQGKFIDLRQEADTSVFSSMEAIFRLNKDIENLQAEDAENVINSIWDKIHENNSGKENIQISDMNILTSIISVLMTNIINSGFSVEKIYGEAFSPESFFAGSKNPDEMKDKVIFLFQKRIEFEKGKKESKSRDVALSAKEYIENNYKNSELSIADISEMLCVNQTYLRKMFKSEMDMTLSEYITQVRMQEAKRLITTTDEKLSTVAENVGYGDVSYFSNVFKKFYGISPRSMCKE
jgi:two-component system response regulator YesN